METTKIFLNTRIPSVFSGMFGILLLMTSCDVFESDPDKLSPETELQNKEVHVYSKNTSVIDLNSIIQSNQELRLELTTLTSKGQLTNLGKGLLQYVPDDRNGRVRDGFGIALFSGNEIIRTDSVVIVVENDSTDLPCGVFPIDDFVYNLSSDSVAYINVLSNDILCSSDSAHIQLSIYKPTSQFPPYSGSAEVVNNMIVYRPGNSFAGTDKIIYKVVTPEGAIAYGFVYIEKVETCSFELQPDLYSLQVDTISAAGILLPVFANDVLCETYIAIDERNIIRAPEWGTATIDTHGINFKPSGLLPGETKIDSIRYEICFDEVCYRTFVILDLEKN